MNDLGGKPCITIRENRNVCRISHKQPPYRARTVLDLYFLQKSHFR